MSAQKRVNLFVVFCSFVCMAAAILLSWRNEPDSSVLMAQSANLGVIALSSANTTTLAATVWTIKSTPGNFYGFSLGNSDAADCYLQVFDALAANVTPGTTVATQRFYIPLGSGNNMPPFIPLHAYRIAITAIATTTRTGGTPCATGVLAEAYYK